jgi:hypothetical protein
MDNPESGSSAGDKFARWQKITIDQLGYALNLILTFTIAALGYCFVLLRDNGFVPRCPAKYTLLFSLLALAISALCGLATVLTRLSDFRGTAKRARKRADAPDAGYLNCLGRTTWVLFYVHLIAFAIGVAALATTILLTYGGKLI